MAQVGLLTRWLRARERPLPLRLILALAGALVLAAAFWLSSRAGLDGRLDLSGLGGDAPGAPLLAVQLGLVLSLWAPALLLVSSLRRPGSGGSPWPAVLLAAVAAVVVFSHAARAAESARRELVEETLAPLLLRQSDDRTAALLESRALLASRPGLADDLAVAVRLGSGDQLAFRLWQQTELAALGYRSSLELLDGQGRLVGSFALEMPPPLPAGPGGETALFDIPLERLVFATLSQEQEVLSSRWTVGTGEPPAAGAVALYVADEIDNLPALMDEPELPSWAAAGRDVRRILGGPPLVLAHDRNGHLVWSGLADPPVLSAHAGDRSWVAAGAGSRRFRLLRIDDGDRVLSVGYRIHGPSRLAARLLRFALMQVLALAALGLAGLLALRPAAGWRADVALLRAAIATSWGRKLAVIVLLASLAPLVSLTLLLRAPMARQLSASLSALGAQSADVARRVVLDAMVAVGGDEVGAIPSDETLYWLSRVVRQDIDLFVDWRLAATSRRGLFTAGLASPLPDAGAYRRIALGGGQLSLPVTIQDEDLPPAVTAALKLPDGRLALLRLPFRRQEAAVQEAGDEVRERADLATAGVALLLVVAAVAVGRGTARRLRRLTEATERLARGDEEVRVEDPSADELGRLTAAFNRMAAALASRRADLRRRTETLESLVHHAPTGIVHLDGAGRILMVNPAAARLLGRSLQELDAAGPEDLPGPSPYAQGLGRLLTSPHPPDGVPLVRDLSPDDSGESRLRAVLVRLPESGGERLLLLEDITESVRSGRLAAWADMARRIAHEIKNPLTPIRLSAEHLLRVRARGGGDLDATLERTLRTILDQVEALRGIAGDFSLYARLPEKRPRPVAPSELLETALAPYRDAAPPGIRFQVAVDPGLPWVSVDPALMRRVLVNLLENALQAMPGGGTLGVRARQVAGQVELTVSDTGPGMDSATLERIFEPYFSTRDTGTGLGLAIARRTVEEHGGRIRARSRPGSGTSFVILLPAADTPDPSR
jgi:C4-dicarboxylate-specific signal transduction histidine kinase